MKRLIMWLELLGGGFEPEKVVEDMIVECTDEEVEC